MLSPRPGSRTGAFMPAIGFPARYGILPAWSFVVYDILPFCCWSSSSSSSLSAKSSDEAFESISNKLANSYIIAMRLICKIIFPPDS